MKRIYPIITLFILAIYAYSNFATHSILTGTYVNRNYKNNLIGTPHAPDTLTIKDNYQFESPYYGKGNYKLTYSLRGTSIQLTYGEGNFSDTINGEIINVPNQENFLTTIDRKWFVGNLKITLDADLDQYYEKIE